VKRLPVDRDFLAHGSFSRRWVLPEYTRRCISKQRIGRGCA
jgi:hypothetical protein